MAASCFASARADDLTALRRYYLPSGHAPGQLAVEPSAGGGVWFTLPKLSAIGRLDPPTGDIRIIALGQGAKPRTITRLDSGRLIVMDGGLDVAHEIEPDTGSIVRHMLPGDIGPLEIASATTANDGACWFTAYAGAVGRFTPGAGATQLWRMENGRGPAGIAQDGQDIWFTSFANDYISSVSQSAGPAKIIPLPVGQNGPKGIAMGRDGSIWVAAQTSGSVLRYDRVSETWITYRLPGPQAKPYALGVLGDGGVVVTDLLSDKIHLLKTPGGNFEPLANLSVRSTARSIAVRSNEIWVSEAGADAITAIARRNVTQ